MDSIMGNRGIIFYISIKVLTSRKEERKRIKVVENNFRLCLVWKI